MPDKKFLLASLSLLFAATAAAQQPPTPVVQIGFVAETEVAPTVAVPGTIYSRNDVQLTRSNLELARVRFEVGATAKSDVLRWESELATSRQAVLDSMAQRELARIELNRVLHRPLEESFSTAEADLSDSTILGDVGRRRGLGCRHILGNVGWGRCLRFGGHLAARTRFWRSACGYRSRRRRDRARACAVGA